MRDPGKPGGAACFVRVAVAVFAAAVAASMDLETKVSEPIILRPHQHEAVQYGYVPEYIVNTPSFDSRNRPYIRSRTSSRDDTGSVQVLEDGRWVSRSFVPAVKRRFPDFVRFEMGGGWLSSRIVFDEDDDFYTCVQIAGRDGQRIDVLVYSKDYGKHFEAYRLPTQGGRDHRAILEHRNGLGLKHPPLILLSEETAESASEMRPRSRLSLVRPVKEGGHIVIPEPVVVTDRCLGLSVHSGGSPFVATIGEKSHLVWAEVTDAPDAPGTPTYTATYDAAAGSIGPKVLLGYGHSKPDPHSMPGICADGKGYLHVILGAHGKPFRYTRSLAPDNVNAGWTAPEDVMTSGFGGQPDGVGEEGRQTYAALVCDTQDALHLVFRQGVYSEDSPYFPGQAWNALAYQRRRPDGSWEAPRWLVVPPASGYAIFYQTLSVDRGGRLYLVYSYRGGEPLRLYYGEKEGLYHYPAMLTSGEHGTSWELAETAHFERDVIGHKGGRGDRESERAGTCSAAASRPPTAHGP